MAAPAPTWPISPAARPSTRFTGAAATGPFTVAGGPDGTDTLTNIERIKFLSPSHVSDINNNGFGDLIFQHGTPATSRSRPARRPDHTLAITAVGRPGR